MVQIPMKTAGLLNRHTVLSINQKRVQGAVTSQSIHTINTNKFPADTARTVSRSHENTAAQPAHVLQETIPRKTIPRLIHPMQKGEKAALGFTTNTPCKIKACLGWNVTNDSCDVDVSAFLLNADGRVLGDSWFVFYGQEQSPDKSTVFSVDSGADREIISIDLQKLNAEVHKIVFVLTINEALEKHLNFSMIQDAYIRIIDQSSNQELAGFQMDEYYSNVTSMMIGELYKHNHVWKFHAIGNGVAKDLAGLCGLYGVQVI